MCPTRGPTGGGLPEPSTWRERTRRHRARRGAAADRRWSRPRARHDPDAQSEACLTAEIFTPDLGGSRPVLVWVPGGSYRIGGASLATYDGARLAAHDVVVVGLNYRLGALGWLAAEGVPTNLGAARPARRRSTGCAPTSASFGGDPDRIVLMGESAGSGAIAHLLATRATSRSPGAILQSGAAAGTLDADTATWVAEQFLDAAGAASVDDLRHAPVDALLAAQEQTVVAALAKVGMMPFHPWVDDDLLTGAGAPSRVPRDPVGRRHHRARDGAVPRPGAAAARGHRGELPREEGGQPRHHRRGARCAPRSRRAAAISWKRSPISSCTCRTSCSPALTRRAATRVFRYRFTWEAPVRRACHALDLPFTFGTLDVSTWREFAGADGARAGTADALSARMRRPGRPSSPTVCRTTTAPDRGRSDGWSSSGPRRAWVTTTSPPGSGSGWARRPRERERAGQPGESRTPEDGGVSGPLDGRVAVVTGASRGIGKGCALELGAAGATVYVTARSVSEADHPLPGTIGATAQEIDRTPAAPASPSPSTTATTTRSKRSSSACSPSTVASTCS